MTSDSHVHARSVTFERIGDDERLFKKVAQQIEQSILEGELKPGDRLPPERVMTQQFGVSRTVIREAFKALELQGLIEIQHGVGAVVSSPSAANVADSLVRYVRIQESSIWALHELRTILETETAALAAERHTEEDIRKLDQIIMLMSSKIHSPAEYVALDLEFHHAIVEAAHNPMFPLVLDPFVTLMRESRRLGASVEGAPQRSFDAHRELLECIRQRDTKSARSKMQAHCDLVAAFIAEGAALGDKQATSQVSRRKRKPRQTRTGQGERNP
jgi:GntR family transcriptional repressor for pyruvate dehydrogenase complex